jgi:glutathione peroxidase
MIATNFYNLKANKINGEVFDFINLKGKKVIIINSASKCGFTKQYNKIQKLQIKYKSKLIILVFPCNDFNFQEQGTNEEILKFCTINFGVDFVLMEKITIKNNKNEVYKWLTNKELNSIKNTKVLWNFQKYLINENGIFYDYLYPWQQPNCKKVIKWLES